MGHASAVSVIRKVLSADWLTDHQQRVLNMSSDGQKAATAGDQAIKARHSLLEMAKLLLDEG